MDSDSDTNMAVGNVPWGPAAEGIATTVEGADPRAKIALVGRGLDTGHPIWALADQLRADERTVMVVECGWPRSAADLYTFGASRSVSRALVQLLAPTCIPGPFE